MIPSVMMARFDARFLAVLAIAFGFSNAPAQAKFSVCNKTEHPFYVAIGMPLGAKWASEGWWRVEAHACQDILRGALKARYYYLRAVHIGVDGAWEGNRSFCVAAGNFSIQGRDNCDKRGYGRGGFFEIDTGDFPTWKLNLSD